MLIHPLALAGLVVAVGALAYGFGYAGGWFAHQRRLLEREADRLRKRT